MTIQATGNVSLGGGETNASVNLELAQSATAMISVNDTNSRILANKPTDRSPLSFSDYRGRSFAVTDPPGPVTNFVYLADYLIAKYKFVDGTNLDTRTAVTAPISSGYTGRGNNENGIGGYLFWGGDNPAYIPAESPELFYDRSNGAWTSFMNTYAIWPNPFDGVQSYTIRRNFNAPYTGYYYLRSSVDNDASVYVDEKYYAGTVTYNVTPPAIAVYLYAGAHSVRADVYNAGGPGGFAFTVSNSTDTAVLWDTRSSRAVGAVAPVTEYPYESAYIDINAFKAANPSATSITMDFRAQWYTTAGATPIALEVTGYKGGTPVLNHFEYTNPTATESFVVLSGTRSITTVSQSDASTGQRLATLAYNLTNGSGSIDVTS